MSVAAGISDTAIAVRERLRGKIGRTRVRRYWPGKAPEWADGADGDGDILMSRSSALKNIFPTHQHSDLVGEDDPRLRRLSETRIDNREQVRADHRRIRQPEIVSTKVEQGLDAMEEGEDVDVDTLEEKRRRIRERLLQREQEEPALLPEEEESEYETDSEDEHNGSIAMLKPVFVSNAERDTIAEREWLEAEEQALEEAEKKKLEQRIVETKQLVVEKIREDEEIRKNLESEANTAVDVDTDDELNESEEYEVWKVREIARIKRDREEKEAMLKAKEEIERVRNMTEEERREWERKNPKPAQPSKQKWKFMQKYFHKDAFFQSEADDPAATAGSDHLFTPDFSAPTGEDKMDKTILPKVMQVKHFGRSGRTKWTRLVNEDTTDWNNPWTNNDSLLANYNAKMAAVNAPIEKPSGSKKLKDWESK